MRRSFIIIIAVLTCDNIAAADVHGIVSLKGTLTTSTRFIYYIDHPTMFDNENVLTSNVGYGIDFRWKVLWDRFFLGVSVESIRGSEESSFTPPENEFLRVPYSEGFDIKLIELSGYYIVPISSDDIRFYMGGGFGLYDGNRDYSIAGVKPVTVETHSNIGIHVLTGVDYYITNTIGIRGELKFRDPHFEVTDQFDQPYVNYLGKNVNLRTESSTTRVNLYGINYVFGIIVRF